MAPLSDRELIAAVLRGQVDAFATLLGRYRDLNTRFAVRMLGSYTAADDALQAAFVRAFQTLARCKEPDRFGDWLFAIVMNECRSRAMRRSVRERHTGEMRAVGAADAAPSDPAVEIQRALDQLDPINREAFVLQYIEELTYPEIAALTSANVAAVEARVDRACARLRELLARMYAEHRRAVAAAEAAAHDPGPSFVARIAAPLRRIEVLNDTFEDRLMAKLRRPATSDATERGGAPKDEAPPRPTRAEVTARATPVASSKMTEEESTASTSPERPWLRLLRFPPAVLGAIAAVSLAAAFGSGYAVRASRQPRARPIATRPPPQRTAQAPATALRRDTVIISRIDSVPVVRFVLVDEAARSVALVGDINGWNAKATPLAKAPRKGVWSVFVPVVSGRHEYAFVVDGKRWTTDPLATVRRDDFGVESSILAAIPSARGAATRPAAGAAAARLEKVLPRAVAERLVAKIAAARADSLPAAALESRALKLAAKGIAPKEIERAIGEQAQRMGKAKDLLLAARGRAPMDGEIEAGEEALKRGDG